MPKKFAAPRLLEGPSRPVLGVGWSHSKTTDAAPRLRVDESCSSADVTAWVSSHTATSAPPSALTTRRGCGAVRGPPGKTGPFGHRRSAFDRFAPLRNSTRQSSASAWKHRYAACYIRQEIASNLTKAGRWPVGQHLSRHRSSHRAADIGRCRGISGDPAGRPQRHSGSLWQHVCQREHPAPGLVLRQARQFRSLWRISIDGVTGRRRIENP